MTKQKRRSQAEWRDLIEQQAHSGLNCAAFCEQHGLSRKCFYRYRKILDVKTMAVVPGSFIKIQPEHAPSKTAHFVAELHYRDSRLHIPVDCVSESGCIQ